LLSKQEEGREGEERAEKTLKKEGYTIIEKNYRTRFGEIDIIAEEKDCLVFVEVKKRNTPTFGDVVGIDGDGVKIIKNAFRVDE
jgi:putative endonuclease